MPGPVSDSYDPDPKVLTCAFCGLQYPPGTPPTQHEALTRHVMVCLKHPLRVVIEERNTLRKVVEFILATDSLVDIWEAAKKVRAQWLSQEKPNSTRSLGSGSP